MTIGYDKPLYILPFDHRSSFETGLFGWKSPLTEEQSERIVQSKAVIYAAFKLSLAKGVSKEHSGIFVDSQFGAAILRDANANGFIACMPVEKSGQAEFQFEFGDNYEAEIEKFQPNFVKALVRYNPEDDEALNRRQAARLKDLSDTAHKHNRYFMFELLVPPTAEQNERIKRNPDVYDKKLRPALMAAAMTELQDRGVEPDVWKIEGLDHGEDCLEIVKTAQRNGRKEVGCIILGRGSNEEKVIEWLTIAAKVPGFIGFAVGRTSFWDPLVALRHAKVTREKAVEEIASKFMKWIQIFVDAKKA
jgi:myo-inositol catabolism protein IolC